jgi:hypothetical protein
MKWSQNKPTKEGFYWFKEEKDDTPVVVEIEKFNWGMLMFKTGDKHDRPPKDSWWYAGPIEAPEESI